MVNNRVEFRSNEIYPAEDLKFCIFIGQKLQFPIPRAHNVPYEITEIPTGEKSLISTLLSKVIKVFITIFFLSHDRRNADISQVIIISKKFQLC